MLGIEFPVLYDVGGSVSRDWGVFNILGDGVAAPATFTGTLSKTFEDDTLPGGPHERTIVYQGPFDRCDREQDYRRAWAILAERFGATHARSAP